MSFRIADFQALLLAGMVCGLLPVANAQSTGGAQRIVFSSPEGQITTNSTIPMAQAPEAREKPDLPAGGVTVHEFSDPMVGPMYPMPLPMLQQPNAGKRNDSLDSRDIRKQMGVMTPGQIMDVPTVEQIFGLPEKKPGAQKEPWQLDSGSDNKNGATNNLNSDTTAMIAEPSWAKLWTQGTGKSTESSNTTDKASGFFSRFFQSSQNDSGFGSHDASGNDTFWGSAQPAQQQSSWDSAFAAGGLTPPSPARDATPSSFTPTAGSGLGFGSQQSPFATPQVSSMSTMPKLPSLPSLPGQKNQLPQPASTPSWTPQPPPWTQAQTPFGTPVINPALKR